LNEGNAVFCEAGESSGGRVGAALPPYRDHEVINNWRLAIESLLGDESRRHALGTQARKDVEKFTWMKREEKVINNF
jgi:hypothetical protein